MISLTVSPETLTLTVLGADRLWTLKSQLEFPLAHTQQVRNEAKASIPWKDALRAPGTHLPGVFAAGTVFTAGRKVFADIREGQPALVLELRHENYDEIMFQTVDLQADLTQVQQALSTSLSGPL